MTGPRSFHVVQLTTTFESLEEAMRTSPEAMAAHVGRSRELHAQGDLLMAGAFLDGDGPVTTMAVLTSREAAEEFVRGDPFVVAGKVADWRIREWANLFT